MSDVDGPLSLSVKQRQSIVGANRRVNIWHGSVSSGKTIASIIAWLHWLATDAPARGELLMIGVTLQSLERNVLNVIAELDESLIDHTNGSSTATILGREVATLGANDARAERRIRGVTAAGVYVDEASLMPNVEYWSQLMNRMRVPGARGFATTNPDNPTHWFKTEVIDKADELGYMVRHFVLDDNPGLDDAYVEAIKRENTGLRYQRNILGLWVLAEGTIWDTWRETVDGQPHHVVPDVPRALDVAVGIDDGTAGTFAAQLLVLGEDDGREVLTVAREFRWAVAERQRQLTMAEKVEMVAAWLTACETGTNGLEPIRGAASPSAVAVDPSATALIRQFHTEGWPVVLADNRVKDGLDYVASLFALNRLRVHESCTGLRNEIPGYVWDPKAAEHGEDKPVKVNDHHCDATRYAVMNTVRWWWDWVTLAPTERAA